MMGQFTTLTKTISLNSISIGAHTGYGNGSRMIKNALESQGVNISPGSNIVLNYCMPPSYEFGDELTIGYTPWESTDVPPTWVAGLRAADVLWTPTTWGAEVFQRFRKHDSVMVVPHGLEECWAPKLRTSEGRFRFVHVGEPAVRKGGDIVLQAWHKAFRHRDDVELVFKCVKFPACRVKDSGGSILAAPGSIDNVIVMSQVMSQQELLDLYYSVDCMVYPTRGEGWGFIPFEAMGSGLPTILPSEGGTADFADYSPLRMQDSVWVDSPEEKIHPGKWLDHSVDEVIDLMYTAMNQRDSLSEIAYRNAHWLHEDFSWEKIGGQMKSLLGL